MHSRWSANTPDLHVSKRPVPPPRQSTSKLECSYRIPRYCVLRADQYGSTIVPMFRKMEACLVPFIWSELFLLYFQRLNYIYHLCQGFIGIALVMSKWQCAYPA